MTKFQEWSNEFKKLGRWRYFHVSTGVHGRTYVCERRPGEIRGKMNLKMAKRAKVRAWKSAS
jgi:hypothetical protein